MKIINLIENARMICKILRSIFPSLYFNFHYLPLRQALKLPILLYKPHLKKCRGRVVIDTSCSLGKVRTGMIKMGFELCSLYPNSGLVYDNNGGLIVFKGKASIGNNSYISIGNRGYVEFGNNFGASTTFRLVSYKRIVFGNNVLFGWDCIVTDNDFHKIEYVEGGNNMGIGEIVIGDGCWIAMKCIILKNTMLSQNSVVSANSLLKGRYEETESMYGSCRATKICSGLYRNPFDDLVEF